MSQQHTIPSADVNEWNCPDVLVCPTVRLRLLKPRAYVELLLKLASLRTYRGIMFIENPSSTSAPQLDNPTTGCHIQSPVRGEKHHAYLSYRRS